MEESVRNPRFIILNIGLIRGLKGVLPFFRPRGRKLSFVVGLKQF